LGAESRPALNGNATILGLGARTLEKNLFRYIWNHSRREQLIVIAFVAVALPFYFASLSLPRYIVDAIEGAVRVAFEGAPPEEAMGTIYHFFLPLPEFLGGVLELWPGWLLGGEALILALSFTYLGLVMINGGFKFQINTLKGRMGERMLRRLRYELIDRVLRFPTSYFRKLKPSEVASMVKDEVEPLGGFIGDAYVLPIFQGGLAFTALLFIILQNFWLGCVAGFVVLGQGFIIPALRRPILELGKQRQIAARELAGRVGELVDGVEEVRINATSNYERADLSSRLGRIFDIRYEIYRRKFFVKFLNNFLGQLTPFLFYAVGGVLAVRGQLDVGQLLAVLVAYKDLPAPVKLLIDWDQQRLDVQIKYDQVIDHFDPEGMVDPDLQRPVGEQSHMRGGIEAANLTVTDETGARLLHNISFSVGMGETLAIVGPPAGGKEFFGPTLVRLYEPGNGKLTLDGRDIKGLPEGIIGRWVGYVGQDTYFFPLSVIDNLTYGLKHEPLKPPEVSARERKKRDWQLLESKRAGNAAYELDAEWVDLRSLGVKDNTELRAKVRDVLRLVGLEDGIYELGLSQRITVDTHAELTAQLLTARAQLQQKIDDRGLSHLVESFHPDRYNKNATLEENLLFGRPCGVAFAEGRLPDHPYFEQVLRDAHIADRVVTMGLEIARTMVELFADLPANHPFFDQFSFISAEDLPDYQAMVNRYGRRVTYDGLPDDDCSKFVSLSLRYIEARHRLGLIDADFEAQLVLARKIFASGLPEALKSAVDLYQVDAYNGAASIQDNLLFGRIAFGQAQAEERVGEVMTELLAELGLHEAVFDAGLDFNVGPGGKRLTGSERQLLGLARAILKRPDILVVDAALAVLDTPTQEKILQNVLKSSGSRAVIWILARPYQARLFKRVMVIDDGHVVEEGVPESLEQRNGRFTALAASPH